LIWVFDMSSWARAPREPYDSNEWHTWREACERDRSVREHRTRKTGQMAAAPRRSESPRLSKLFASPRSTYQDFCSAVPPPRLPALPEPANELCQDFNRHKFTLDWNTDANNHDIFPVDEDSARRKKIQGLRAQVQRERQARKDTEHLVKRRIAQANLSPRVVPLASGVLPDVLA